VSEEPEILEGIADPLSFVKFKGKSPSEFTLGLVYADAVRDDTNHQKAQRKLYAAITSKTSKRDGTLIWY
jgi:hypothetical protein